MTVLGQRIRDRREAKRLSQTDLALLTDSTQKQIWLYESAKGEPSIDKLKRLADALGTTTDYLLGLSDDINPHYDESSLDLSEQRLLKIYRAKTKDKQESILAVVQAI